MNASTGQAVVIELAFFLQWIEKLTYEANEWKAKYIKSEAEKKSLVSDLDLSDPLVTHA